MKKRLVMSMLVAGMAFSVVACGKKDEVAPTEAVQETESGGETEEEAHLMTMAGKLVKFTGSSVEVQTDDGEKLTFDVSAAKLNTTSMVSGDDVMIVYEGEIVDGDTSKVVVDSVIDNGGDRKQETQTMTGTLIDSSMNTVSIRVNDGTEYTFSTIGAALVYKNGIELGNWLQITYVGQMDGNDTQSVQVIEIVDEDANIETEKSKVEIKAVEDTVYAAKDVNIRTAYSTDAEIIGMLKKGDSIKRTGICDNGWMRVVYQDADAFIFGDYLVTEEPEETETSAATEKLEVEDVEPATEGILPEAETVLGEETEALLETEMVTEAETEVETVALTEAATEAPTEMATEAETEAMTEAVTEIETEAATEAILQNAVSGTIAATSNSTLEVLVDDAQVIFDIGSAQLKVSNGLMMGNEVTITYTGDLKDMTSVAVVAVEDDEANADGKSSVAGEITGMSANTITVATDEGAKLHFAIESAEVKGVGEDGLQSGDKVTVVIDISQAISGSNVFTALEVDVK